jgi:hypothetical protein
MPEDRCTMPEAVGAAERLQTVIFRPSAVQLGKRGGSPAEQARLDRKQIRRALLDLVGLTRMDP